MSVEIGDYDPMRVKDPFKRFPVAVVGNVSEKIRVAFSMDSELSCLGQVTIGSIAASNIRKSSQYADPFSFTIEAEDGLEFPRVLDQKVLDQKDDPKHSFLWLLLSPYFAVAIRRSRVGQRKPGYVHDSMPRLTVPLPPGTRTTITIHPFDPGKPDADLISCVVESPEWFPEEVGGAPVGRRKDGGFYFRKQCSFHPNQVEQLHEFTGKLLQEIKSKQN